MAIPSAETVAAAYVAEVCPGRTDMIPQMATLFRHLLDAVKQADVLPGGTPAMAAGGDDVTGKGRLE
jgi:hypothetical protein